MTPEERELALVDRVIGLEARLARAETASTLTPTEQLAVEQRLVRLRASTAWRVGWGLTAPVRVLRRILGRSR